MPSSYSLRYFAASSSAAHFARRASSYSVVSASTFAVSSAISLAWLALADAIAAEVRFSTSAMWFWYCLRSAKFCRSRYPMTTARTTATPPVPSSCGSTWPPSLPAGGSELLVDVHVLDARHLRSRGALGHAHVDGGLVGAHVREHALAKGEDEVPVLLRGGVAKVEPEHVPLRLRRGDHGPVVVVVERAPRLVPARSQRHRPLRVRADPLPDPARRAAVGVHEVEQLGVVGGADVLRVDHDHVRLAVRGDELLQPHERLRGALGVCGRRLDLLRLDLRPGHLRDRREGPAPEHHGVDVRVVAADEDAVGRALRGPLQTAEALHDALGVAAQRVLRVVRAAAAVRHVDHGPRQHVRHRRVPAGHVQQLVDGRLGRAVPPGDGGGLLLLTIPVAERVDGDACHDATGTMNWPPPCAELAAVLCVTGAAGIGADARSLIIPVAVRASGPPDEPAAWPSTVNPSGAAGSDPRSCTVNSTTLWNGTVAVESPGIEQPVVVLLLIVAADRFDPEV